MHTQFLLKFTVYTSSISYTWTFYGVSPVYNLKNMASTKEALRLNKKKLGESHFKF